MSLTPQQIRANLPEKALTEIDSLPFPKIGSGKVREIYDVGEHLLMIASDRVSTFDVVLPTGIPGKGMILTQLSLFWFEKVAQSGIIGSHLALNHNEKLAEVLKGHEHLIPSSMLVRKLNPLPVEAVVRGYVAGSGWKDYQKTGKLFGQDAPANLKESSRLPEPYFTPTTKAKTGHDMPMSLQECRDLLGDEVYEKVHSVSLKLFALGTEAAERAGLILADTKFEFGVDDAGKVVLIDEILTSDSSRYWPADEWTPGKNPPAFDKQYVRDYVESLDWDKTPPGPELPDEVVNGTLNRYLAAIDKLMAQ